jgi:hypothetical protein
LGHGFYPVPLPAAAGVPLEQSVQRTTFIMTEGDVDSAAAEEASRIVEHWPLLSCDCPEMLNHYRVQLNWHVISVKDEQRRLDCKVAAIEASAASHAYMCEPGSDSR